MKSCFFIGHREASEEIFPELAEAVERHIVDYGVTEFIVGNYGGFDRIGCTGCYLSKGVASGNIPAASATLSPGRATH